MKRMPIDDDRVAVRIGLLAGKSRQCLIGTADLWYIRPKMSGVCKDNPLKDNR